MLGRGRVREKSRQAGKSQQSLRDLLVAGLGERAMAVFSMGVLSMGVAGVGVAGLADAAEAAGKRAV